MAKGKLHKRYECGCKAVPAVTSQNNWLAAEQAKHDNPYDGQTLDKPGSQKKKKPHAWFCFANGDDRT